ncbi:hypothetical protein WDU94_010325 [Cyamophila willieti]
MTNKTCVLITLVVVIASVLLSQAITDAADAVQAKVEKIVRLFRTCHNGNASSCVAFNIDNVKSACGPSFVDNGSGGTHYFVYIKGKNKCNGNVCHIEVMSFFGKEYHAAIDCTPIGDKFGAISEQASCVCTIYYKSLCNAKKTG